MSIETAQQIALDTVKEMFGENAQAVIATHDDTGKIHNHIMLNVFDLTGKRFHSCKESLKKLKEVSDEVCQRYGIQPFDRENYVRKPIISGYHEWKHLRNGTSWKQQIRDKIDELIPVADNYDDLKLRMEQEGFTFKDGKYVCVKAPGQERFARLKTIGDNYTPEKIAKRIVAAKGEKIEKFSRCFYNVSIEINTHAGAYSITKPIKDMCGTFIEHYTTIRREHLEGVEMVQAKLKAWEHKCVDIQNQIRELEDKIGKIEQEVEAAYHYFDNMNGFQRLFPKKDKDKEAVAIVKEHDFGNRYVVEIYARQLDTMKAKLSELKDQLTSACGEVRKYATTEDGLKNLIAKRDELREKATEAREKANYYSDRAADYDSILQAVREIDIYPPERKPEEKKQNAPKKKLRR